MSESIQTHREHQVAYRVLVDVDTYLRRAMKARGDLTVHQVAKEAGVGVAVVRRVLSGRWGNLSGVRYENVGALMAWLAEG